MQYKARWRDMQMHLKHRHAALTFLMKLRVPHIAFLLLNMVYY